MGDHDIFRGSSQDEQYRLQCPTPDGIEPIKDESYGIVGSSLELGMEALISDAAGSGNVHPSVDGIKEESGRLLDEVNPYKMEEEKFQKVFSEKGVAMRAMTTSLLNMK